MCGETKELNEFSTIKKKDKVYHLNFCKLCKNIKQRIYNSKDRDRVNGWSKKWIVSNYEKNKEVHKKNREKVRFGCLTAYGGNPPKCACCGESHIHFLCIDHINNDGAEQRRNGLPRAGVGLYQYLKKNNYPSGFQILCHNCNCAKGFYGICPHKVNK